MSADLIVGDDGWADLVTGFDNIYDDLLARSPAFRQYLAMRKMPTIHATPGRQLDVAPGRSLDVAPTLRTYARDLDLGDA